MNREAILALSGVALREAVCERLGIPEKFTRWMVGDKDERSVVIAFDAEYQADHWKAEHAEYCEHHGYSVYPRKILPAVESSLDAARLVEDEVERRGPRCVDDFCFALEEILPKGELFYHDYWRPLRAASEQICRAALLAVEGEGL